MIISRYTNRTAWVPVQICLTVFSLLLLTMLTSAPAVHASEEDFCAHDELGKDGFVETQYRPGAQSQYRVLGQESAAAPIYGPKATEDGPNSPSFMQPSSESFARQPAGSAPSYYGGNVLPPTGTGSVNLNVVEQFSISNWTYLCAKYQHRLGSLVQPYVDNQDAEGFTTLVQTGPKPIHVAPSMRVILNNDPTTGRPPVINGHLY